MTKTTTITDAMIERAARAYVRAVQSTWDDVSPNFKSADWKTFEDETWQKEKETIRKALEAALA